MVKIMGNNLVALRNNINSIRNRTNNRQKKRNHLLMMVSKGIVAAGNIIGVKGNGKSTNKFISRNKMLFPPLASPPFRINYYL